METSENWKKTNIKNIKGLAENVHIQEKSVLLDLDFDFLNVTVVAKITSLKTNVTLSQFFRHSAIFPCSLY